jgi:hypothetical protein
MLADVWGEMFAESSWQMARGEQAAVRGVLSALAPGLTIEIGTAAGAALRELAQHSREVHSFDLIPPTIAPGANVVLHTGDSHVLLPAFLAELAQTERNVDLVVVDGDHTPEGVRRDLEDLLNSPAVAETIILIHDTINPRVRSGVDAVRFEAWAKVAHVELDWIPGHLFAEPALRNELWFGLGLVVVDVGSAARGSRPVYEPRFHPAAPLMADAQRLIVSREADPPWVINADQEADALRLRLVETMSELAAARESLAEARQREHDLRIHEYALQTRVQELDQGLVERSAQLATVVDSRSWQLTRPLRTAMRRIAQHRAG